jgi:predicted nucleic acid-binding protein
MAKIVLTDACFWLGLIDPKDQFHDIANKVAELIEGCQIIFPWPCLYETISTHLSRRHDRLLYLEEFIKRPDIVLLDDEIYKVSAFEEVFRLNRTAGFTYSLVDSVIREVLKDVNVRINYLVTFNERDFIDICQMRRIEIIN